MLVFVGVYSGGVQSSWWDFQWRIKGAKIGGTSIQVRYQRCVKHTITITNCHMPPQKLKDCRVTHTPYPRHSEIQTC